MTENEIKEMLKDIIDNGAEYEFRWLRTDGWSDWKPYRLGEEILCNDSRYEYRKVEKWYVVEFEDGHFQIENTKKYMDVLFEGSKEECEKWLEEHTKKTWLEEYLYSNYGENAQYYIRIGAKEVCKKILEELNKNGSEWHQTVEHIIQYLGVEI